MKSWQGHIFSPQEIPRPGSSGQVPSEYAGFPQYTPSNIACIVPFKQTSAKISCWYVFLDIYRTIRLLTLLEVNLCSTTHSWVITRVLTQNLGVYQALPRLSRVLLNHLVTSDLLDMWET